MSTKLHTLAVTQRLNGPAGETALLGSYMDGFRSSEIFPYQQNFHIEQFNCQSEKVLLVSKILAGPKTVHLTAKISSFDPFVSPWNQKAFV